MRLVFDVETDGLLRDISTIHCIVAQDLDTGDVHTWDNGSITKGLDVLASADELWGHNIIGYDYKAIQEMYPNWKPNALPYDTLILSRLFFTDLLDRDFRSKPSNMPANLYGRHSLEAWGHRIGVNKSEYGKTLEGDWSTYSPEMLDYCRRDVEVSVELAKLFLPKIGNYQDSIRTEHDVAEVMAWQERCGFPFDTQKAHKLESSLRSELELLSNDMRQTFTLVNAGEYTPKVNNRTRGYVKGAAMCRVKEFNPTSRQHIAWAFQTHRAWTPDAYTDTGTPKIDEKILQGIGTDESKKFARILELQKHLGQLSEGKNAWLKKEHKGRIHHGCFLNTNTGRNCHVGPNLAQVPSEHAYRELFGPGDGRLEVGSDASSLELRCLGHYLSRFDGGSFAREVVEGDIHTQLAEIYGTDRRTSKTVTYCLIYGGGNTKLGLSAGATDQKAASVGKKIRDKVLTGLRGFAELSAAVSKKAETGVLRGLDGRPLRLQGKQHAALNYLLQGAGAVVCKRWVIRTNQMLQEAGVDYYPLAFVHDEMQLSVHPDQAEMAGQITQMAMKDVQQSIEFRCELDSEFVIGDSWADTH